MCSMNRVNETYACENNALLTGLLKEELGFPGLVYADAGAQKVYIDYVFLFFITNAPLDRIWLCPRNGLWKL